jgi:hypothetical protein
MAQPHDHRVRCPRLKLPRLLLRPATTRIVRHLATRPASGPASRPARHPGRPGRRGVLAAIRPAARTACCASAQVNVPTARQPRSPERQAGNRADRGAAGRGWPGAPAAAALGASRRPQGRSRSGRGWSRPRPSPIQPARAPARARPVRAGPALAPTRAMAGPRRLPLVARPGRPPAGRRTGAGRSARTLPRARGWGVAPPGVPSHSPRPMPARRRCRIPGGRLPRARAP